MGEQAEHTIGRYRVRGELGKGGMAIVWRAFDPQLNREVAVKVMRTACSVYGAEAVERFQRELKAMALVAHPNVIRIFDGGAADDMPFIVTELLEGKTIEQLLREDGRLSIPQATRLTEDLLEALLAVHAAGLVHRDIKPSNLMVTTEGRLVLMDFGIALSEFNDSLTRTGEVPGTLAYLPPECLGGHRATPPSDLFQVSLVLYEMLIGKPLFGLRNPKDFLLAHGELPPKDLAARREGLPTHLCEVLQKSLEPDPVDRYRTAQQMLDALREAGRAGRRSRSVLKKPAALPPTDAAPRAHPGRSSLVSSALLCAAAVTLGGAAAALWRPASPARPTKLDASVSADSMDVSWSSSPSYRGAVEVNVGQAGSFVAEEVTESRYHTLRIPGSFEGLTLSVRVGAVGGEWSEPMAVGGR